MLWTFGCGCNEQLNLWSWLHSFSLSRVSHKGEFYLDRFLMRQPLHNSYNLVFCYLCLVFSSLLFQIYQISSLFLNCSFDSDLLKW